METQQGFTLWLTGMSGAGKSALASYLVRRLPLVGRRVELIDASELGELAPDEPHTGREERDRTVRLLGWVAKLLTRNGTIPVVASISPHREVRDEQRRQIGRFFEVMVECPFEILMERDTKGIYRRALAGEVDDVVGVQTPYEPPQQPEAVVDMARGDVEAAAAEIFEKLASHGYLTRHERDVLVNGSAPADAPAKASRPGKAKASAPAAEAKGKAGVPAKKAKPAAVAAAPKSKGAAKDAKPSSAPAPSKAKPAGKPVGKPAAKAAPSKAKAAAKVKAPAKATKAAPKAKAPAKVAKPAPKKPAGGKAGAAKAKTPARMAAGKVRAAR